MTRAARLLAGLLMTTALCAPAAARAAMYPNLVDNSFDRIMSDLVIPQTATTQGMWGPVNAWPMVGLHISVLPSGQVLSYGANGANGGTQDGRVLDVWDPALGLTTAAHTQIADPAGVDSFCGSSALLANGQLLVSGGSSYSSNDSSQASSTVTPSSLATATAASLNAPRWYGSMTTLPDGRQIETGGSVPYATNAYADPASAVANNTVSMTPEVYSASTGRWTSLMGANSRTAFGPDDNRFWYPHQFVAPNGKLFGISANQMWWLDPAGNGSVTSQGTFTGGYSETTLPNIGPTSTASMYQPGLILQVGGNGRFNGDNTTSSRTATVFDVRNGGTPAVHNTAAMNYPRQWANSLMLPTGRVLVTGGTTYADNAGANAVYAAETWDPATEKWTLGASAAIYRGYHSATTLLPDGAVLSSGGGVPGPVTNLNAEIYYPPYLFQNNARGVAAPAARPSIVSFSANTLGYGATLNLELGSAAVIGKVALIRLGVTTHSFNTGQVYVNPAFSQNGNAVSVTMPKSGAVAPPGYYQVVVLDGNGVPSRAAIVGLGQSIAAPPAGPNVAAAEPAPWTATNGQGAKATRVAAASDGSVAWVDNNAYLHFRAGTTGAWKVIGINVKAVAVVNANSVWVVSSTDAGVWHWTPTVDWTQVGVNTTDIAASADGTIVVVNSDQGTLWQKTRDDNVANWVQVPGTAKRVAVLNANSRFTVGFDNNIYHWTGNQSAQIGFRAQSITVSQDGSLAITNNQDGTIWKKNNATNDADNGWTQQAGLGNELAWKNGTSAWLIGTSGVLFSK